MRGVAVFPGLVCGRAVGSTEYAVLTTGQRGGPSHSGRIIPPLSVLALALLFAAGGCGGSRLVAVTGKVTYQGRPVPSTLVTFQPADGGRPSKGVTDDQGLFALAYSRDEPGVVRGPHAVFLTYFIGAEEEMGTIKPKATKELKAVIAKYGDPKTSPLHYEVTKSGQVFDIQLE